MARSYVDALAARYYGQLTGGRRMQNTAPAPSSPNSFIQGGWQGTGVDGGRTSAGDSGGIGSGVESLPEHLQNPTNPYDWFLQKTLAGTNPWSKFVMAASDPDTNIGKVVDVLAQPMYANTAQTADVTSSLMRGDLGGALGRAVNPLQYYGTGNDKKAPSDILRGDKDLINDIAQKSGVDVQVSGDVGPLAEREGEGWQSRAMKGIGGLAADIAGDPLTALPGAVAAKAVSVPGRVAVRGIRAAGEALPDGNFAARLAGDIDRFGTKIKGRPQQLERDTNPVTSVGVMGDNAPVKRGTRPAVIEEPTTPVGTDIVPTGQVLQDVTESTPRIIPEANAAAKSVEEISDALSEAWVPSGKRQRMMQNQVTGEVRPYDATVARGASEPKYPGMKITDIWKEKKTSPEQQKMLKSQQQASRALTKIADELTPEKAKMLAEAERATRPRISRQEFNKEWFAGIRKAYDDWEGSPETYPGREVIPEIEMDLTGKGHLKSQYLPEWVEDIREAQKNPNMSKRAKEALSVVSAQIIKLQDAAWEARKAEWDAPGDPGKVVRAAQEAASTAAEALSRRASRQRLTGAALSSWTRKYATILDPEELAGLLSARSYKEFAARRQGISRKKVRQPSEWVDFYVDVLSAPKVADDVPTTNVFEEAKKGLTTSDQMVENAPRKMTLEQERAVEEIRSGKGLDEITTRALMESMDAQLWRQIKPEGEFHLETARGTRRNAETLGEGRGINRNGWNRKAQMNLWDSITTQLSKEAKALNLTGFKRSRWMKRESMKRIRAAEDFLLTNHIYSTASNGQTGMPLQLSQMIEAVSLSKEGRQLLDARVFTGFSIGKDKPQGLVDVDALLHIGNIIADTVGKTIREGGDDVDAAIRAAVKEWLSKGDRTRIKKALEGTETYRAADGTTVTNIREIGNGKMIDMDDGTKFYDRRPVSAKDAKGVVDEVVAVFENPAVVHTILQFVHENTAAATIQFGRNVGDISEQTIRAALGILDDMTGRASFSDKAKAITNPKSVAQRVNASYRRGVTDTEIDAAAVKAEADMAEVVPEIDIANAETAQSISRAGQTKTATAMPDRDTNLKTQQKYDANVQASLKETSADSLLDPDDVADIAMQTGLFKMLDPLARTFVAHFGNATFHEALTKSGSVGGVYDRVYRHQLTAAERLAKPLAQKRGVSTKVVWKEAWDGIRRGDEIEAFPAEMRDFALAVRNVIEPFFAAPRKGETQSVLSMFQREGFDIDHINFKMSSPRYKLPEHLRFEKPNTRKGAKPETVADISQQWRKWEIDDPLDFMAKIQSIATEVSTEVAISREFFRIGSNSGLVSTKPRSGFVRVDRNAGKQTAIEKYLPVGDKGEVYMHPDAYREMKRMNDLLQRTDGRDTAFNNFIRNNLDPILSMWKSGMTIWRPGHHVRTLIGDLGMAYLVSGLKDPRYYARSLKMVTQRQGGRTLRGKYGQWDAQKALQGFGERLNQADFPTGNVSMADEVRQFGGVAGHYTGPAAKVRIGNKKVELDSDTIHKMLMDRGVLPDFRRQEDIIDAEGSQGLVKALTEKTQITGGRARTALGNFTEGRDDFVRIAHALHLLESKGYKSLDDAFDSVAATLRKAHPDGTDLTPFERNVMRRVFPFYSWTRKAIPLIIENMLLHPGRFNVYPKAMYNFAQSMGVDLESMSEPFPDDQLFPKFMTEKMTGIGYQADDGRYFSFDVGIPQADIMNEFFAGGLTGSIGGVAGMLNPAIKMPIELQTGTNLATRAPINDTSDYIDSQIPGINAIASITGTSPTGTLANLLSGRGTIDEQYQAQRGNRGGVTENPEYLINYLTGMRLTDASKPNYIRLAQIQKMQEMQDEASRFNEVGWGK